jgi:hypothetical protein
VRNSCQILFRHWILSLALGQNSKYNPFFGRIFAFLRMLFAMHPPESEKDDGAKVPFSDEPIFYHSAWCRPVEFAGFGMRRFRKNAPTGLVCDYKSIKGLHSGSVRSNDPPTQEIHCASIQLSFFPTDFPPRFTVRLNAHLQTIVLGPAVEHTHSWFNRFRNVLTRWSKKAKNRLALPHFVCALTSYHATSFFGQAVSSLSINRGITNEGEFSRMGSHFH